MDYWPPVKLLDQQRELEAALRRLDPRLASMYLGCLRVLADVENPEALPLAAHAARELMRAVPSVLDVPMKAHKERLGDKVRALQDKWAATARRSSCRQDGGGWSGTIDTNLAKALRAIDELFRWMNEHMPRRRDETIGAIRRLERATALPDHLERANAAAWEDLVEYFNGIAHHNTQPERQALEARIEQLEHFLLARVRPRTFDDFSKIDDLLREVSDA